MLSVAGSTITQKVRNSPRLWYSMYSGINPPEKSMVNTTSALITDMPLMWVLETP